MAHRSTSKRNQSKTQSVLSNFYFSSTTGLWIDSTEVSLCGPLSPEIDHNLENSLNRGKMMTLSAFFFFLPNVELQRMRENFIRCINGGSKKLLLFFEEVVDNCSGVY